eukprot:CAMPEP_0113899758 /NCGR_PEP_ID=MMETSP0780_2-20120614/20246_1 /TAXON_ID=652834 /ORGANISM="Palpitomonas bilix" /LENGTH=145 /DNA_ID=CAMNT_0000892035 /DNA_START=48 /DNA_END=485 /DNA_ORIENTATION=- /assembly_acc=CAM_ASM_000599
MLELKKMLMKDADTRQLMWESEDDWASRCMREEVEAHVPPSITECAAVSREIVFHSDSEIKALSLTQSIFLGDQKIEVWDFEFGFVIPGSTNSWEQTIYGAGDGNMIPVEVLNGNIVIETVFFDGEKEICKSRVRVYYDANVPSA